MHLLNIMSTPMAGVSRSVSVKAEAVSPQRLVNWLTGPGAANQDDCRVNCCYT
jgi:hypothetical protein